MRTGALPTLLLGLFLFQSGCGKKESSSPAGRDINGSPPPVSRPATETPPSAAPVITPAVSASPDSQTHRFRIRDIDNRETLLAFKGNDATFRRIRQPIVIVTLLSDWCPPCRGMLPALNRLQQAERDDLFVIGILVRSDLDREGLRRFMERYGVNFFISLHPDNEALAAYLTRRLELGANYPLPLTLIFKNGKYVMNIRGAAPYEMLQTLVEQLKSPRKKKE